jgi:ribosomal protein L14E/L6E/L27E
VQLAASQEGLSSMKFVCLDIIDLGALVIAGFSINVVEPYDSAVTELVFLGMKR